jgi:tetratricopeptide (TPR) repeat protein
MLTLHYACYTIHIQVLLGGQAIWYDKPTGLSKELQKLVKTSGNSTELAEFWHTKQSLIADMKHQSGLNATDPHTVVFMCPQNVFKLHPDYDTVLQRILLSEPTGYNFHLVLQLGNRPHWSQLYIARLTGVLGAELMKKVHFIPRVAGGSAFLRIVASADILLHPFPFGGSKTSSDSLLVSTPLVTMATDQLRGRMAASLLHNMGLHNELVCSYDLTKRANTGAAAGVDCYVALAVRLATDVQYRHSIVQRIYDSVGSVWERTDVIDEWDNFLRRAAMMSGHTVINTTTTIDAGSATTGAATAGATTANTATKSDVTIGAGTTATTDTTADTVDTAADTAAVTAAKASIDTSAISDIHRADASKSATVHTSKAATDSSTINIHITVQDAPQQHTAGSTNTAILQTLTVDAINARVHALHANGQLHEALAFLQSLPEPHANTVPVLNNKGALLHQLGRSEEAIAVFRQVLLLAPTSQEVLANAAATLQQLQRLDEAEQLLLQALEHVPPDRESPALIYLANLMRDSHRNSERMQLLQSKMRLQDTAAIGNSEQSYVVLVLALMQLLPQHEVPVRKLQQQLGILYDLWSESLRIQKNFLLSANELMLTLLQLNKLPNTEAVYSSISNMPPVAVHSAATVAAHSSKLHMIEQYYIAPQGSARQAELDECLRLNAANVHIGTIHVLLESASDVEHSSVLRELMQQQQTVTKLNVTVIGQRLTYRAAFEYANAAIPRGHVFILSNSDIYFDNTLSRLGDASTLDMHRRMFALRWWGFDDANSSVNSDYNSSNTRFTPRIDSQDSWILQVGSHDITFCSKRMLTKAY